MHLPGLNRGIAQPVECLSQPRGRVLPDGLFQEQAGLGSVVARQQQHCSALQHQSPECRQRAPPDFRVETAEEGRGFPLISGTSSLQQLEAQVSERLTPSFWLAGGLHRILKGHNRLVTFPQIRGGHPSVHVQQVQLVDEWVRTRGCRRNLRQQGEGLCQEFKFPPLVPLFSVDVRQQQQQVEPTDGHLPRADR